MSSIMVIEEHDGACRPVEISNNVSFYWRLDNGRYYDRQPYTAFGYLYYRLRRYESGTR